MLPSIVGRPMNYLFRWGDGQVGVVKRSRLADLKSGEVLDAKTGLATVEAFARNTEALAALRKLLAEDHSAGRVARMSDADVIAQIRQGLAIDQLLVVRERRDWRTNTARVEIVDSPPPAASPQPPRTASQPPPAQPCTQKCTNPACAAAFTQAAAVGAPTVERGGPNC